MKREELEQLMASFIYGEINEDERKRLDEWLQDHPEDRRELDELRQAHALLGSIEGEVINPLPCNVTEIIQPQPVRRASWHRWAAAVAACVAVVFCLSQGVVVQVGSTRVAFGNAPEIAQGVDAGALRKEIRQELQETYLPTLTQLTGAVNTLNDNSQKLMERQDTVDNQIALLTTLQTTNQKYNDKRFQQFANELVDELEKRLTGISRLAYGYSPQPAAFRTQPIENSQNK